MSPSAAPMVPTAGNRPSHPDRPRPRGGRSPRRQRDAARWLHLAAALAVLVFVYGPAALTVTLQPWMQMVVLPLLSLTGLVLWKQARIRRLATSLRRRTHRPASTS